MSDQDNTKQQQELAELRRRIAELEAADHNRQRLEKDLDLTFRLSPMLMCIAGFDGYLKRANPVYQETCGLTQEELLTLPYIESMHPDDRTAFHAVVDQLAKGVPVFNFETRMRRPDESVRLVRWTGIPMTEAGTVLCIGQDITASKVTEEAMRASEEKFHSLFQNSAVGTVITQDGVSLSHVNPAFCAFLGYSEDELRGKTIQSLSHPDDWEESSAAISRTLDGGPRTERFEKRYLHKSGQVLWGEVNFTLVCDAAGKPDYFITQVLDITDRKRAEAALQKALDELERRVEERTAELAKANEELTVFRRFAEASGQGFGMADLEGHILYVNPAFCRMLGEDHPANTIGRHISAYFREEARQQIEEEILPAVLAQGQWNGESAILLHSVLTPTLNHAFLVRDESGEPLCLAISVTDITERKQAEAALRQSRDELQAIYDGMVDGLHILNLATLKPVRANSALCRMMGYSEEEVLLLSPNDVHPAEELPRILAEFQAYLEGQGMGSSNVPMVRKDGSIFYADITASRIVYDDVPSVMCFFRDVTERKRAQEALERERQSLWRMLQASDHERQIISYDIHDGLAQYLAAAGMQFQVFDAIRESNPEEAKKAYDAATQLVRQSHSESRRLINAVRPPVIDENGIEMAISHLVHEQRRHGGPTIKFDSDVQFKRLPSILENAIYRIVQEALTNACKHSKAKRVAVTLAQEGQDVRLEVRDWGIGFDPDSVEKGHFGLEGIRQRVRLLGGRLNIESTPGSGTTIQVVVPIVEQQDEE